MTRRRLLAVTAATVCSSFAATAAATEYFVESGANGAGTSADPFGSVQAALDAVGPGDIVTIRAGTYTETAETKTDGTAADPITVRAEPGGGTVKLTNSGRVLRIHNAHYVVEGIVVDGQYGDRIPLDVNTGPFTLRDSDVGFSTRDCIDIGASVGVRIEGCVIHHCLNSSGGRTDAHGLTGGATRDLVVADSEIHSVSGDAIQFDPGRSCPGWDNIRIENSRLWLEPLPQAENGFAAGTVPGENAVDTKTCNDPGAPRATLTIVGTTAWGWRNGLIGNMAAFNIKENVDTVFDGVTVFDSEIAFRLRGPGSRPGAHVRVANAVVYDVDTAIRYEDDIENLRVWNATFGRDVGRAFQEASSDASVLDVRNLLVLGGMLPSEATDASNLSVDESSFVNASAHDYHLADASPARDSGTSIAEVTSDRDGTGRPQGPEYDVGAYEHCAGACAGAGGGGTSGGPGTGGTAAGGAAAGGGAGAGGVAAGGAGGTAAGGGAAAGSSGSTSAGAGGTNADDDSAEEDGGCGCRAPGSPPQGAGLGLLALVGALWTRRRATRRAPR